MNELPLKPEFYFREMEIARNIERLRFLIGDLPPHIQLQMREDRTIHELFVDSFDKALDRLINTSI